MKDLLEDFYWTVAPAYDWQDWRDKSGKPVSVPKTGLTSLESASAVELLWNRSQEQKREYGPVLHPILRDASELRRYHPMDRRHAALFQEFAGLDYTTPAAVLDFAKKYGALGVQTQSQFVRYRGNDRELHDHHAHGEPFLRWALEICFMQEGIRLLGRRRSLSDLKRLKWLFDRNLQHFQGRLAFTRAGDLRLAVEPLTLIAAMWLQLALAVTGNKRFPTCKFCGRMFEISTDESGYRSHREFCTDSCKTQDYRRRRTTAARLAEAGENVSAIATKTGTDIKTVRGWLTPVKSRKKSVLGEK